MADGSYRFQQSAGQQYYYPQNHQAHHQRHLQRNGSPVSSGRIGGFPHDTPSPTRSPGTNSPAHSLFGMYNQTHQQNQHPMLNGGPPTRGYPMPLNLGPHKYQNHPAQHHQQPQDHGSHGQGPIGHQHSYSGGTLSNSTPHFTPSHLHNGAQGNNQNGTPACSEDWQRQLELSAETRTANTPNYWSRKYGSLNTPSGNPLESKAKEDDNDDTRRARPSNEPPRQDWIALDIGGHGLRTVSPTLFMHYTFLDKLYMNGNKLVQLPPAIGRLRNLNYLDVSSNQLRELPAEIGMLLKLRSLLLFDNEIRRLPSAVGSLYSLETLGVDGNPLDDDQKQEMMQNGTAALITQLRENAPRPDPPAPRDWIILDDTAANSSPPSETISVFTYNSLCPKYATEKQYGYSPSWVLSWEYRRELILQEIRAHNPDIVCLQEVDRDGFDEFFCPQLAYNDYKGVFWPRPRAKTMAEREAKAVDGCATFYKGSKYIILDKQIIDLANTAINRPDMKGQIDIYNRVMPRDNIAIGTFLENRMTGSRINIVNVHLFWDPAYKDVKLVQTAILMEQISKIADKYVKWPACKDKVPFKLSDDSEPNGDAPPEPPPTPAPSQEYSSGAQIPLVICGDFNSTTDSGVYDLIARGTLPKDHPDLVDWRYGNFTRDGMAHPFSLKSSYAGVDELSFTNYTPDFTDVIDYVWYSTNSLQVTGLLGDVDKEYLRTVPGFPNYHFPSDHLAIMAELLIKGRKEKRPHQEPDFGSTSNTGRRRD
ncbi:MAG: pyridoxine biosynthesis protein [Chaenotheca gracillima]|nr:MAG: pyridoxine biosynthesis protein [Chaenotheca gracillima]